MEYSTVIPSITQISDSARIPCMHWIVGSNGDVSSTLNNSLAFVKSEKNVKNLIFSTEILIQLLIKKIKIIMCNHTWSHKY